jgi:microcompartment protein CcmK/EutM
MMADSCSSEMLVLYAIAREADEFYNKDVPSDAVVVAIIDSIQVEESD